MSPVVHKRVLSDYSPPPPLSPPSPLLCFSTSNPPNSLFVCVCGSVAHAGQDEFLFIFFFIFFYKDDPTPQLHQPRRRQAQANRAEPLPRTGEYLQPSGVFFMLYNVLLLYIDRSVDRLPLLLFQCRLKWGAHTAAPQYDSCLLPSPQCFCCFRNVIF